jgi:cytochrome P450
MYHNFHFEPCFLPATTFLHCKRSQASTFGANEVRCAAGTPAKKQGSDRAFRAPPRKWRLPYIGFFIELAQHNTDIGSNAKAMCGPVYRADLLGTPHVSVNDAALILKTIRNQAVTSKDSSPHLTDLLGPDAVITQGGSAHSEQRARLNPVFSPSLFPYYFAPSLDFAYDFWTGISKELSTTPSSKPVLLAPLFRKLTFATIVTLTSGLSLKNDANLIEGARRLFTAFAEGFVSIRAPFGPWRAAKNAKIEIVGIIQDLVEARLEMHAAVIERLRTYPVDSLAFMAKEELKNGSLDILTVLLAETSLRFGDTPSPERTKEVSVVVLKIIMLWAGGYETVAATLASSVFELWHNKEVLQQIRDEQDALAARSASPLSVANVMSDMPLLDAFVMEVLRIRPPASGILRKVGLGGIEIGGFSVKEGSFVVLDFLTAMRDEKLFPDPLRIDLTRYDARSDVDSEAKTKAALARQSMFAFGLGAHRCIGSALALVEIKSVLAVFLRGYDFELSAGLDNGKFAYNMIPVHAPKSKVPLVSLTSRVRSESVSRGSASKA